LDNVFNLFGRVFCGWRNRGLVSPRCLVPTIEQTQLDAPQLAVPGGMDELVFMHVCGRRTRCGLARKRISHGILELADCLECAVDARVLWSKEFALGVDRVDRPLAFSGGLFDITLAG
jgi:hypothetical protein